MKDSTITAVHVRRKRYCKEVKTPVHNYELYGTSINHDEKTCEP